LKINKTTFAGISKRYRYFRVEKHNRPECPRPVYDLINNRSGDLLGEISYYGLWKQWVFIPFENTAWSIDCLINVKDFMGSL